MSHVKYLRHFCIRCSKRKYGIWSLFFTFSF